jgi:hypothetical protein
MEPPADGQAAVDEIRSVFPPHRCPETIPDFPYPLDAGEKTGDERLQGDVPGSDHRPEGFGKIIRPPAEFVRIIEGVGQELSRATGRRPAGPESLMVADGVSDACTFLMQKGKRGQELFCLFSPPLCMLLLRPADVVEDAGELRQEDQTPDAGIRGRAPMSMATFSTWVIP